MERLEYIATNIRINTLMIDTYIYMSASQIDKLGTRVFPNVGSSIYTYINDGRGEEIIKLSKLISDFILRQNTKVGFDEDKLEIVSDYIAFRIKTMEDGGIGRRLDEEEVLTIVQNLLNFQSNFTFFR